MAPFRSLIVKTFYVPGDAATRIVDGRVEPAPAFLTEPHTCMLDEPSELDGGPI
jgi:hypothetical protein